jgi:hypothetical protein
VAQGFKLVGFGFRHYFACITKIIRFQCSPYCASPSDETGQGHGGRMGDFAMKIVSTRDTT